MSLTSSQIIIQFEKLKKKYHNTPEFKNFVKKYRKDIEFIRFKKKHGLRYSQKTGKWNKPFSSIIESIWIKDKKHWNKGLKKHGYYQIIQKGWKLGNSSESMCLWCGKLLKGKETKFCFDNNGRHRKQYSKVIMIGKKRYRFDLSKPNHILIKPKLFDYEISESGQLIKNRTDTERIQHKDIEFVINGKREPLTKKSRTI